MAYDDIKADLASITGLLAQTTTAVGVVLNAVNALPDPVTTPPVVPPPPPPIVVPPNPTVASGLPIIGVNSHPQSATPAATVALLKQVGARIARLDMNDWDAVENPKGTYNLTSALAYVAALRGAGIAICVMCGYNSHLYTTSKAGWGAGIVGATNIAGYVNFCKAVANAINGTDVIYEMGNEPDIAGFWNPVSASAYGIALSAGAAAIKSVQPNAVVVTAGISDINGYTFWGPYIQTMISSAGDGYANVDGLAFHTYNGGDKVSQPPEDWIDNPDYFPYLKSYSAAAPRPFYITENGYPTMYTGSDTTRQGILNARALLTSIVMGVKAYIHYDLIDDGTDYTNSENTYGLFLHDGVTPKPSATAFTNVMAIINRCTSFSILAQPSSGHGAYNIRFDSPSETDYIVWTNDKTGPATVSLGVPANPSQVKITDVFGTQITPTYVNGVLTLTLTEAAGPLLVSNA